jgi:NAD binding domain of 6-phosphogluconate dehydrogenase
MSESIAVVGLGEMGSGAARRLLDQRHRVVVWNRTRDKVGPLIRRGAKTAESPGEAAAGAAIVITFLADDRALEGVVLGPDGVASGLGQGGVHLSMSTIAPTTARTLAEAHGRARRGLCRRPGLRPPRCRRIWPALDRDLGSRRGEGGSAPGARHAQSERARLRGGSGRRARRQARRQLPYRRGERGHGGGVHPRREVRPRPG